MTAFGFNAAQAEADAARVSALLAQRADAFMVGVTGAAFESIVEGSPVTGAPGQPVGQYGPGYHPGSVGGTLKGSWSQRFLSATEAEVSTNLIYAPAIEDQVSGTGKTLNLRSSVGGFHSVKLTIAGIQALANQVAERLNAGAREVMGERIRPGDTPEVMGGA
jgi:hypothetical protein